MPLDRTHTASVDSRYSRREGADIKAAVLRAYGSPISIEEVQLDAPRPGEVLVRLAASGVCRSDLHNARGVHEVPLPIVLGHEGAGVVAAVGEDVGNVSPGDH